MANPLVRCAAASQDRLHLGEATARSRKVAVLTYILIDLLAVTAEQAERATPEARGIACRVAGYSQISETTWAWTVAAMRAVESWKRKNEAAVLARLGKETSKP